MTTTPYVIDEQDVLPFGILNNNFNFNLVINNETWRNCSQYIYINCLVYILNHISLLSHREEKYISIIRKCPTYETYNQILDMISNDSKYNFLYSSILAKLNTPQFDSYILNCNMSSYSTTLQSVVTSVRGNLLIKKHYNLYPSFLVTKIIKEFLLNDLEDFTRIQQYLHQIESKNNILHDIIQQYGFNKVQTLHIYDFEFEVETNKELLQVLELADKYPNILFIYAFKYNLRNFKNRMEVKYRNKILELFLKYKNKYTESIKKEIYIVHNRKLKDIIVDQVLTYDDKFRKYVEKDAPLRQITSSMISEEKLHDYENFNFFDIDHITSNNTPKTPTMTNNFSNYLSSLDNSFSTENILPSNLEKVKMVLATIAIHKKFQIVLPQNQIDNYTNNLPAVLKSHVTNFNQNISEVDDRLANDIKCMLFFIRGIPLKFKTEDNTLASFIGPLISNLAMVSPFRPHDSSMYRDKPNINYLLENDLFFNMWVKRQLQYTSNLISCLSLFLEINSVSIDQNVITDILTIFSDTAVFTKLKTSYDDVPTSFSELIEYYFTTDNLDDTEKKSFVVLIWNFVTYNLQIILKTRDTLKAKQFIIKNILRLRSFHQCVENQDNNDIACYTFAAINVGNKMKKLMERYNINLKSNNIEKYVEAVILNNKQPFYDDAAVEDEEGKDIKKIVNEIFTQNETVIKSYLSHEQITKLINTSLLHEELKYKINMWVTLTF